MLGAGKTQILLMSMNKSKDTGRTLAAWDAMVDVERIAQGYNDDCKWIFGTGIPDS